MITLGADPEFILRDAEGRLKSAIGVVPGRKEQRYDLGNGHQAYYDNVLAECSIKPGASAEEAVENFRDCFKRFAELIQPNKLCIEASATFPEEDCKHEEAQRFGCDPEICAYDVVVCAPPKPKGSFFRTAGGHVHMGYDGGSESENEEDNIDIQWNRTWIIRMCDLFLGVPSILIDHDPTSKARRRLYGNAGRYRQCFDYGVEYRSLGNFWLASPRLVELVYDLGNFTVDFVLERGGLHEALWDGRVPAERLRQTINEGNEALAEQFLSNVVAEYAPNRLLDRIREQQRRKTTYDFYKEWNL